MTEVTDIKQEDSKIYESINSFCTEIFEGNRSRGFWDDELKLDSKYQTQETQQVLERLVLTQKLALVVTEIAEAIEGVRKDAMDDKLTHRRAVEVECADAVIRIFDLCGAFGWDLSGAIKEKLEYNASRPYKHGKRF